MKKIDLIVLLTIILCLAKISNAQLKYVNSNKGATVISASYSRMGDAVTFGGQINFTRSGNFGVGALYEKSWDPDANAVGILCEFSLYRPVEKMSLGINLLGGAALSWSSTIYTAEYYDPNLGTRFSESEKTVNGQSALLGAEAYLHSPGEKFKLEPFIQVSRTFSKVYSGDFSKTSAQNSFGIGIDFITGNLSNNFIVFTPGIIFHEYNKKTFILSFSFIHAVN